MTRRPSRTTRCSLLLAVALLVPSSGALAQDASTAPPSTSGEPETYCITVDNPSLLNLVDPGLLAGALASGAVQVLSVVPCSADDGSDPLDPEASPDPSGEPDARVAFGAWADVGDWRIRFSKVDRNAWPRIKRANMFNEAPPKGYTYVMAYLEYQYTGADRERLDPGFGFKAVGPAGVEYTQFTAPTCGVLPDPNIRITDPVLRAGGQAKGWICWAVKKGDAGPLIAFTDFLFDETYVEFALR